MGMQEVYQEREIRKRTSTGDPKKGRGRGRSQDPGCAEEEGPAGPDEGRPGLQERVLQEV